MDFIFISVILLLKFLIEGKKEDAIKKFSELSTNNNVPIEIKNREITALIAYIQRLGTDIKIK